MTWYAEGTRRYLVFLLFTVVMLCGIRAQAKEQQSDAKSEVAAQSVGQDGGFSNPWDISYLAIFYGPGLGNTTSYQPTPTGQPDRGKPVLLKNWATLSYSFDQNVAVSAAAYWHYQPVLGHQMQMKDPYVRIQHNSLLSGDHWNVYADLRVHFPVTTESRMSDLLTGIQGFQAFTYEVGETPLTFGIYNSVRYNVFGKRGYGSDLELYFTPNLYYQVSPKVALTLLYETNTSHTYGDKFFSLQNDGTDLEPGVNWQVTEQLNVNPYLHLYPGDKISLKSTSFGMMLNFIVL